MTYRARCAGVRMRKKKRLGRIMNRLDREFRRANGIVNPFRRWLTKELIGQRRVMVRAFNLQMYRNGGAQEHEGRMETQVR